MKTALVTGGTGGIGSAICIALAQQGYKVVAGFFPPEKENAVAWQQQLKSQGIEIELIGGDVSDFESSGSMVNEATAKVGPIDVLVNCAGITRDVTLKKMEPEQWEAVMRTNLDSAFNVTRHLINGMLERGYGRIVNIAGQKGQFGQTNYSAAKAGLHGFTMALAQETARKGVTVNTISPGYISTPMTQAMPEKVLDAIVGSVPMGRMGEPEEIAHTVLWLADEKSAYTTGANIPVNGGLFMAA
ncbi:MAG: acetoacetyl-CoA reductase [Gammaproteobacteria bacterium]|nr:MAG: acetoacetyl-CoA reductase [Gammaproteobacteria bacterium]